MHGTNGKYESRLTFSEYVLWQGWNELPECADNPPLTVETPFLYKGIEYMVTTLNEKYVIVSQPEFTTIISNDNFKLLLEMPFIDGKSFHELIGEFLFDD